ncbi:glycerate kinase [Mycolicibacterium sp. P1-18]|uniref:glycerate kinase n=1 Tax=Mycolicibacterium sp. P1-18 TaxID=2024615 RepID=UPI0011F367EA|nr:glycerate kinase [Mycolicibacterium sp. P1-18]KAA0097996.1 glycerate kinase [Mycolicibacterium sp. P1-18]
MGRPTVIVSPDSLKGCLSAADASAAVAAGITATDPGIAVTTVPLSDGGEGLVDVLRYALGGELRTVTVSDPLGRATPARYLVMPDGRAVTESAQAIGLTLLTDAELDPFRASSRGLGELIAHIGADPDVRELVLGVGGVATVDGGVGMREALPSLPLPVRVASDVHNPLLGDRGAAAVFGPQKGAAPSDVPRLERALADLGHPVEVADHPGAGAAGGIGAMLLAMGGAIESGIDLVLSLTGWADAARTASIAVTGEGTVDLSSTEGKVVSGVLAAAGPSQLPVVVFGGRVHPDGASALLELGATDVRPLSGRIADAADDLYALGVHVATRLLSTTGAAG